MHAMLNIRLAAGSLLALVTAVGCTSLHQAGGIVGVNKQAQLKPALAYADDVPPPPAVETMEEYLPSAAPPAVHGQQWDGASGYGGEADLQAFAEPSCQAPFLREPTCEAPIWREPSCAGPGMGPARNGRGGPCNQALCPCATCVKEEHVHENVPAPHEEGPHGCLTFGGGHVSIPLPTIQFPGFFRVPAFRHALIPVAEPTFVGVPAAAQEVVAQPVAPVALQPAAQVALQPAAAVVAQPPQQQVIPVQLVQASNFQPASAPEDCKRVAICEQDYQEYLRLKQQAGGSQPVQNNPAGQPTPAAPEVGKDEVDKLRAEIERYETEIDALMETLKPQAEQK